MSVWTRVEWDDFTPKHSPLEEPTSGLRCGADIQAGAEVSLVRELVLYPPTGLLLCCDMGQVTTWSLSFLTDKM